jgi:hypothetical protein
VARRIVSGVWAEVAVEVHDLSAARLIPPRYV